MGGGWLKSCLAPPLPPAALSTWLSERTGGTDETLFAPLTEQLFHVRNIQDFPA